MASAWYAAGIRAIFEKRVGVLQDPLALVLVDTSRYSLNLAAHSTQANIPDAALLAEMPVSGRALVTLLDGSLALMCDDTLFSDVPDGSGTVGAAILMVDTGKVETSTLLAYLESPELPIVADGSPFTLPCPATGLVQFQGAP